MLHQGEICESAKVNSTKPGIEAEGFLLTHATSLAVYSQIGRQVPHSLTCVEENAHNI